MITKEALVRIKGIHTGKMILFNFIDLNKIFTWNEIEDLITKTSAFVIHHNGNCGHVLLKNFGLQGYYLAVPVEKYRELQ